MNTAVKILNKPNLLTTRYTNVYCSDIIKRISYFKASESYFILNCQVHERIRQKIKDHQQVNDLIIKDLVRLSIISESDHLSQAQTFSYSRTYIPDNIRTKINQKLLPYAESIFTYDLGKSLEQGLKRWEIKLLLKNQTTS